MEENKNDVMPDSNLDSGLQQMFADYNKSHENNTKTRPSREDILSKYFVPRKDKEVFRILPPKKGRQYIETAFFHTVKVNTSSGKKKWRKIYCPAHNDPKVEKKDANGKTLLDAHGKPIMVAAPCPLCAKYKNTLAKQDQSLKGIKKENMTDAQLKIKENNDKIYKDAIQYQAKKFFIVKGIDKGAEKDGPKFWRFKFNFKKQGVHDKLIPALADFVDQYKIDFTDPEQGSDLHIRVVDNSIPGSNFTYRDVSSITARPPSKLHYDSMVLSEWLSDDLTWRDVFKPASAPNITSEEYMEMVARGTDPYWDDSDQSNKKWVFPGRPDLEELANTRNQNLDADDTNTTTEYASDLNTTQSINKVNQQDVGTYADTKNVSDVGAEIKAQEKESEDLEEEEDDTVDFSNENVGDYDEIDDLPF